MNAWPDAARVLSFLDAARRRLAIRTLIDGLAAGFVVAAIALIVAWLARWPALAAAVVAVIAFAVPLIVAAGHARSQSRRVSSAVERRAPDCKNLLITADELMRDPAGVRPDIGALVVRHAARTIERLQLATLFPMRNSLWRVLLAAVMLAGSVAMVNGRSAPRARDFLGG